MNNFTEIMEFRHACKLFDDTRQILESDFKVILEGARLSPSSFGVEPWHFLVVQNNEIKKLLSAVCWNQPQITTCSHLVLLLSRKPKFFEKDCAYLNEAFGRKAKDETMMANVQRVFNDFITKDLGTDPANWAKMQVYIAGTNMMNSAASIGIDSCPIEGFNAENLRKVLIDNVSLFDEESYEAAFIIAFGYRVNKPSGKIRWPLDKIVTFVK